jgi:hypothetical protein
VATPSRGLLLCRAGRRLMLLGRGQGGWRVDSWRSRGWQANGALAAWPEEAYVAAACKGETVALMTDRRLVLWRNGVAGWVPLSGYTKPDPEAAAVLRSVAFLDGDGMVVGTNSGEWGGGLFRVSLTTGRVTAVAGAGGPVNAIAPMPGQPGCVVVAVGLYHILPSGRLSLVCGNSARRLYARALERWGAGRAVDASEDNPYPSVAFYGLVPSGSGDVRAIGVNGLYRIAPAGDVNGPEPFPRFVARGGVRVARVGRDFDLVLAGIGAISSLGGAMPLAVPR